MVVQLTERYIEGRQNQGRLFVTDGRLRYINDEPCVYIWGIGWYMADGVRIVHRKEAAWPEHEK